MGNIANDRNDNITDTLSSNGDTVTLAVANYTSVACTLLAGTLAATVLIEESFDGGTNYVVCSLIDPSTGIITAGFVTTNPSPIITRSVIVDSGATHVRLRVSAYTSGSADAILVATSIYPQRLLSYGLNNTLAPTAIRSDAVGNLIPAGANLCVTGTAASGTGVTITLPSVNGQFHYITGIELVKYFTAANAASGTPLVVTTTNIPGSLAYTFGQPLGVIGVTEQRFYTHNSPIKSSASGTNTTIVCPATTGIIWRATAHYFTAP